MVATDHMFIIELHWDEEFHGPGAIDFASGYLTETISNGDTLIEGWIRAIFENVDGQLVLEEAGLQDGDIVSGSLDFNGYAFDTQF